MLKINEKLVTSGLLKEMGPNAYIVLIVISIHMDETQTTHLSNGEIRELTGLGVDSVGSALFKLKELGLLKVEEPFTAGAWGKNIYSSTTKLIHNVPD